MAFVVEDGNGTPGANSYAELFELEDYAVHRLDLTGYSEAQQQAALVIASSDWLDGTHALASRRLTETQGLHFPTVAHGLPTDIKIAAIKAALLELQGLLRVDLSAISQTGSIESESKGLGPLQKSVTYRAGSAQTSKRILPADLTRLLMPYCIPGGLGRTVRL